MSILSKSQGMGVAALLLAASAILSRLMGLVRDKVISWQFGAGNEADIYFAAFVVPDLINYLLAGGFLGITLMPLLARRFAEDEADGWKFFSTVLTWMGLAALVLTTAAMIFVAPLSRLVAPGLEGADLARLQVFMRITLPAQFFFLTGSCVTSLLFLRRQFAIPALAPLIYNGCIIFFGVSLPWSGLVEGMSGYCIGVVLGAALGTLLLPLHMVRKMAHFAEFMMMGFWFMLCLRVYTRHFVRHMSWPLLGGLTTALMDETIQLRIPNRSSSVVDVWIDMTGVVAGLLAALVILLIVRALTAFARIERENRALRAEREELRRIQREQEHERLAQRAAHRAFAEREEPPSEAALDKDEEDETT